MEASILLPLRDKQGHNKAAWRGGEDVEKNYTCAGSADEIAYKVTLD